MFWAREISLLAFELGRCGCESDKTNSRPLERQRTVPFDKLSFKCPNGAKGDSRGQRPGSGVLPFTTGRGPKQKGGTRMTRPTAGVALNESRRLTAGVRDI